MHSFFWNILQACLVLPPASVFPFLSLYLFLNKFTWQSACQDNLIFLGFCSPIFNIDGFLQVFNHLSSPCTLKTLMQVFQRFSCTSIDWENRRCSPFFFICGGRITRSWGCLYTLLVVRHSLKCSPLVLPRSSILLTLEVASHGISFSGSMVDSTEMAVSYCHSPMLHIFCFPWGSLIVFLHNFPAYVYCADATCPEPVQQDDGQKQARDAQPSQYCRNHSPRSFKYMPGFKPKIQVHWSEQVVRNLSNSQRELNVQKILRHINLC